jgi:hypothetical protein
LKHFTAFKQKERKLLEDQTTEIESALIRATIQTTELVEFKEIQLDRFFDIPYSTAIGKQYHQVQNSFYGVLIDFEFSFLIRFDFCKEQF